MIVPVDEAFAMTMAALRRGGVVAIPTDTVYGLAALPGDEAAMERLFELKARSDAKSIAVLVAVMVLLIVVETLRFAEARERIRHEED